jgi:hypothetical protein
MDSFCRVDGANTVRYQGLCEVCPNKNCFWWLYFRLPESCSIRKSWNANNPDDVRHLEAHEREIAFKELLSGEMWQGPLPKRR